MTKKTKTWATAAPGGVVIVLATLVLLPHGIRWAAQRWIRQQGQATVSIGDVDFNPFTGRLGISNLEDPSRKDRLDIGAGGVEIAWLPLFRKRVQVEDVSLSDVSMDVELESDGTFRVGGLRFLPSTGAPPKTKPVEWGVGLGPVDLKDVTVRYRDRWVEIDLRVNDFHLDPLATWAPDRPSAFHLDAVLNGGRIRAEGTVTPFGQAARGQGRLRIEGVRTVKLAKALAAAGVSGFDAVVDADARVEVSAQRAARKATFRWEGSLRVAGLKGRTKAAAVENATIAWDGRVEADATPEAVTVSGRGKAGLEGLRATLLGPGVSVERGALRWEGTVGYGGAPSAEGNLDLGPWSVRTLRPDGQALALEGGELSGIRLSSPTDVEVERLDLRGLRLLERVPSPPRATDLATHHLSVNTLSVGGLRIASHRAEMGKVTLGGLRVEAARKEDGELDVGAWTEALPSKSGGAPDPPEPQATPWSARVDEVTLGGDSRLAFRDASVSPPYEVTAEPFALTAGPVDTADPSVTTRLTLTTKTGKYSKIAVEGAGRPLADRPSGTLDVTLEQIRLPRLTPYTQRHLGYRLKSGTLDLTTKAEVAEGRLVATNALGLNKLDLVPLDADQKDELTQDLGLPLNTALSLLRDKNDDIELDIPVEGALDDPEFGVGDAIGKALTKGLSKAVTGAAITYFAPAALAAAGPVGALLAAGKLISLASALRFDPVAFPPGTGTLESEAVAQVDKLGALLVDRPAVRLTLCGVATEADRTALVQTAVAKQATASPPPGGDGKAPAPPAIADETLLELATARAEAVKDRLVTGNAVDPSRLLVCSPELRSDPEGAPRVLISL